LGADGAVAVHEALVEHAMVWIACAVEEGIAVEVRFTGDNLERLRVLCGSAVEKIRFEPQQGEDLGDRLANAIEFAVQQGSPKVAVIGTDCPALDLATVEMSFAHLDERDLVLGPAADGGYYLIALRKPVVQLFQNISWGDPTVLHETLRRAQDLNMTFELLPSLPDIDRPEDLVSWMEPEQSAIRPRP
jgi:rSAM/selenodomain-associated transferase 1